MKVFVSVFALVAAAAMLVYSCGGSESTVTVDPAKGSGTTTAISGAQLYADNCVVCHGQDGKAGMSGATDLSTSVLSHENTVGVIANGRNGMRAFSNQFSKEEIEALAKHVEALRK